MKWNSNNTIRKAILNRWGIHQHRNQIQVFSERNLPGFQLYLPLILKQIVSKYLIERTKVGKESSAQQNITYEPVKRTHNMNHSGSWCSLSKGSETPRAISLLGEILLCSLLNTWQPDMERQAKRSPKQEEGLLPGRSQGKREGSFLKPDSQMRKTSFPHPRPWSCSDSGLDQTTFSPPSPSSSVFFFFCFLSVSLLLPSHSLSVFRKHQPKIPFHLEQTEDSHFKNP